MFFTFFLIPALTVYVVEAKCGAGYEQVGNKCRDIDECNSKGITVNMNAVGVCDNVGKTTVDAAQRKCSNFGGNLFAPRTSADVKFLKELGEDMYIGIKWIGNKWRYMDG